MPPITSCLARPTVTLTYVYAYSIVVYVRSILDEVSFLCFVTLATIKSTESIGNYCEN